MSTRAWSDASEFKGIPKPVRASVVAPRGRVRGERTSRGFTLLEVLVALTIVGMLVVAVLGTVAAGTRAEAAATETRRSAVLAADLLASLTQLPTPALRALDGRETSLDPPFDQYQWSARVRPIDDPPGLVQLQVSLTGPERKLDVFTLLHRPAPPTEP